MKSKTYITFLLSLLVFFATMPGGAESIPEFVAYQPDNRFAEVRITESVLAAHAPWKTDGTREILRTGFFINNYSVIAGGIRPDLVVSMTVRLSEESRPIPASITYFDTELGLALISLHTDATGNYTYYNAKRRKSKTRRLSIPAKHDKYARGPH